MNQEGKEDLRHAVLEVLASKPTVLFRKEALSWRLLRLIPDLEYTPVDLEASISVLEGFGLIKVIPNELGAIPRYQVSSRGVVFHERWKMNGTEPILPTAND